MVLSSHESHFGKIKTKKEHKLRLGDSSKAGEDMDFYTKCFSFVEFPQGFIEAYDRVEWYYILVIYRRLGFDSNWIDKIKLCISCLPEGVD